MMRSLKNTKKTANQKGFALVIVIVVLLLASFLASQLILKVKTELTVTHNVKAREIGNYLAEAGTNMGIFRVLGEKPLELPDFGEEEEWLKFYEGYNYEFFLPLGRVIYYAVNETGKIDLNKSNQGLLKLFLEYHLGKSSTTDFIEEDQVEIIIDSLMDWRDTDDLHRLSGAESEFYEELEDPYIARNGKIEDVSEFFLINGTESLRGHFDAMDVFSVYNPKGKININSLTPEMLKFVTSGNEEMIEAYREAKQELGGKVSKGKFREIVGDERYGELSAYITDRSGANKYYFIVGIGTPGLEEDAYQEEQEEEQETKTHQPGSQNSILIKKEGSKYTFISWQERYI